MIIKRYKTLKKKGVMSINQRNRDFVLNYNERKRYPLVDNKLKTKQLAIESGISVPELFAVIEKEHQLKQLETTLSPHPDFVIKPAHGAGGDGIVVIQDQVLGRFRQINGKLSSLNDLSYHISNILSGAYSLGGHPDQAIIEHRVKADPVFEKVSFEGIPDIRIIVLLGYPAIAMLRLPTRLSEGKANLHQGAIGAGVNLSNGITLGGVLQNSAIDQHPDTLNPLVGIQVPHWDQVLNIAAKGYELSGLGYLGVDIVLDEARGPLMLELNARPGLNIQIANRVGLVSRLKTIEQHVEKVGALNPNERIQFSKLAFRG